MIKIMCLLMCYSLVIMFNNMPKLYFTGIISIFSSWKKYTRSCLMLWRAFSETIAVVCTIPLDYSLLAPAQMSSLFLPNCLSIILTFCRCSGWGWWVGYCFLSWWPGAPSLEWISRCSLERVCRSRECLSLLA